MAKQQQGSRRAVQPAQGGALVSYDEQLAALARRGKNTTAAIQLGQFLSFRGATLSVDGAPVKDNRLQVVVVDYILENNYFGPGRFDPSNTKPPVCYAFGEELEGMAPHAESPDPQHATCDGCPMNEWASAEEGRGKACKNQMRVAVLAWDGLTRETAMKAPLRYAKVPVTSVKAFGGYCNQVTEVLRLQHPMQVVTLLEVAPDTKTQLKVTWTVQEMIKDKGLLQALAARSQAVQRQIAFPYPAPQERDEPPARGGRAQGNKGAARQQSPRRF